MIDIPTVVRNKAASVGALAWLDELPTVIAELERSWSLHVGQTFGGASEAFVAEAMLANGTPAVLKLVVPTDRDTAADEITVLELADGEGCARLLRADAERGALLLERLGPSLYELALPIEQRHEILCSTAARLWRPAPDSRLETGAAKGERLIDYIIRAWEELDRPCTQRAVDCAIECATRRVRAHDDERAVLVHGDVHQWNTLQARDGYKLVDPDGLLADAEYDLGIVMREDPEEMLDGDPQERSRWLAARTGLDEAAIWEWGVVERMSTGLLCTAVELQPVGRQMLAVADRVA